MKNYEKEHIIHFIRSSYRPFDPWQEEESYSCDTCHFNNATMAHYRTISPLCYTCSEELRLYLPGRIYINEESEMYGELLRKKDYI